LRVPEVVERFEWEFISSRIWWLGYGVQPTIAGLVGFVDIEPPPSPPLCRVAPAIRDGWRYFALR
jgi:hypothetical protein